MTRCVKEAQAVLRHRYKAMASLAMVTDHARTCGPDPSDPFHTCVEPMKGSGVVVPVGVHGAVGGPHDAPTPGDLLCAALAACQDSAIRMVANRLGVEITALEVRVSAMVDVRGTLGMEADAPVGFQAMTCEVDLQVRPDTPARLLEPLRAAARRSCVVQQTLLTPPEVVTRWSMHPGVADGLSG